MMATEDGGYGRWRPQATVAGKWQYCVEQRKKDGLISFMQNNVDKAELINMMINSTRKRERLTSPSSLSFHRLSGAVLKDGQE